MDYQSQLPNTSTASASDLLNMSSESARDTKRRSSQRSIKRRRFDDELVEYSLGLPTGTGSVSKVSRSRTYSLTNQDASTSAATVVLPPSITNPPPAPIDIIKKRPPPRPYISGSHSSHKGRNKKRNGPLPPVTTKDLGRWKPTDDLALITAVQRVNDIRQIHRGIKFSCRFTVQEIQQRWYALMYDQVVSRVAVTAMRNLHPELVANVQAKTLYSVAEEELLGTIKSTDSPTLETFTKLLQENQSVFFYARTPKSLMNYWQMLKLYQLLPDQIAIPPTTGEQLYTFSELEQFVKVTEPSEIKEDWLESELRYTDRKNKCEIRQVEDEMVKWQVLVDSVTGMRPPEFDNHTLAILRGRLVRYLMRSREITIGRNSKNQEVDVDLSLEGPVYKVSRRQGMIKLRNNGDFFISSEGKRPIFVDGRPLMQGNKYKLSHNSTIEIASLKFTFLINKSLVMAVRNESTKLNLLGF